MEKGKEYLADNLVNNASYSGKKFSTNRQVPGSLTASSSHYEFMRDVIKSPLEGARVYKEGIDLIGQNCLKR